MSDPTFKIKMEAAAPDVHSDSDWQNTLPRPSFVDAPKPRETKRRTPERKTDPFRLGFRYRTSPTADGRESVEQVPLAAEDLLYPQEGDVVADGLPHNRVLHPKADSVRRHMKKFPNLLVTCDVVLVLRSDGKNCAPDLAVIDGDVDVSNVERGVHLRDVGGRLVFALEVVSTSEKEIEEKDTRKNLGRYAREGVTEYFTVYPIGEGRVKDLVGRTLVQGAYVLIAPDATGRVYSAVLDLFFQIDAKSKELLAYDATTGQRLLISDEEKAGRKKTEAALGEEKAGRKKAEAARGEAEAALGEEAEKRQAAEKCVEQEAEKRRQIELEKEAVEARNRQMTAELEQLRAKLGGRA
jgi:hypothetical protein